MDVRGEGRFSLWLAVLMVAGLLFSVPPVAVAADPTSSLPPQVLETIQNNPQLLETIKSNPQAVEMLQKQGGAAASPSGAPIGKGAEAGNRPTPGDKSNSPGAASKTPAGGDSEQAAGQSPGQSSKQPGAQSPESAAAKGGASEAGGGGPSLIEAQYRSRYGATLGNHLTQFGYNVFANAKAKTSSLALPRDDYRIGPGDKLRIRVWGSGVDSEYVGVVERNGTIDVPQIGIVDVGGVPYGQVSNVIRRESEKYVQGCNVNVSLVDLRSVEVYVVGSVPTPGLHLVPAFSTVFDGLLAAGGVSKSGTLRNIELYRDGKLYQRFDLYDLLLHGKRNADLELENRDVIFVPRLGRTVALAGAVGDAAIFELNGEKTVADCLKLAGGLLPQGYGGRLHLRRYQDNREFVVHDLDTERDPQALSDTKIKDGDLIEWIFLSDTMPKVVYLDGHVWQPDMFQYKPGMTLADILPSVRLLKPGSVTDFAILRRYDPATTRYTPQRIPLPELFDGKFNLPLKPYDRLEVLSRQDVGISEEVNVGGAVWKPGSFPYSPGMTLGSAIALAGGHRFGALLSGIEVSRQRIRDGEAVTSIITLDYAKDAGFVLQPHDYITVKEVKDANTVLTVHIRGEVRYPGEYKLNRGEKLSDLIQRAGGFLPDAYFYGAKFTSERARKIQQQAINDLISELDIKSKQAMVTAAKTASSPDEVSSATVAQEAMSKAMNTLKGVKAQGRVAIRLADLDTFRGSEYDFTLEGDDTLYVPQQYNFVSVVGSVYSPNSVHYEPNRTVDYYLKKSGGPTKDADDDSIYIMRANGETFSKRQTSSFAFSSFGSQVLMPGDTIVVPVNFDRVPYLRLVKDMSDIVFKIATTAGVALAIHY